MNHPSLHVRRATVEDLPALKNLWTNAHFPADELESRLTEFQVVESHGEFSGALGVQVIAQHALLHSEDYVDFSIADPARELFWERIQKLVSNLGVFRIWTQETSPFWTHWGFHPASTEVMEALPEAWKTRPGNWLTLELKNEEAINQAIGGQFAGFMNAEKQQTARIAEQGRKLRMFLTVLFFGLALVGFAIFFYLLFHRHPLPHP